MFCEKLTEEQIRKVMNVISDDGALTILKIRTYDKSFEDAVSVSAVPEVTAKFQEDIETYQLHDYFIRGKNRAGAGSDYIYRKMMYAITPGRTVAICGRLSGQAIVAIVFPPNAGRVMRSWLCFCSCP